MNFYKYNNYIYLTWEFFCFFFEKGFLNALKEAKIPFCTRMRFNAIFFIKGAKRGLKQKNATSSITEPRMA